MDGIVLKDYRCFHSYREVPIAPLTFLVGENSTGKSSFLASAKIAWNNSRRIKSFGFNDEPFSLGAFKQIANLRLGQGGGAKEFEVGLIINPREDQPIPQQNSPVKIIATFGEGKAEPTLTSWRLEAGEFRIRLIDNVVTIITPRGKLIIKGESIRRFRFFGPDIPRWLSFLISDSSRLRKNAKKISSNDAKTLEFMLLSLQRNLPRDCIAFAPIRTTPKRTYDSPKDITSSTGDHVPGMLADLLPQSDSNQPARNLYESLIKFGKASGLFDDIKIKLFGKNAADPFQIKVKNGGPFFNIVDVGYGVSQALPLIVDAVINKQRALFLMQQPEVHLHPKGQAALGEFLVDLAYKHQRRFIVETHSDYLLNRAIISVRDRKLNPKNLSILFFERNKSDIDIHPINIDEYGNILNAPGSYRDFFLKEERRFLGLE